MVSSLQCCTTQLSHKLYCLQSSEKSLLSLPCYLEEVRNPTRGHLVDLGELLLSSSVSRDLRCPTRSPVAQQCFLAMGCQPEIHLKPGRGKTGNLVQQLCYHEQRSRLLLASVWLLTAL